MTTASFTIWRWLPEQNDHQNTVPPYETCSPPGHPRCRKCPLAPRPRAPATDRWPSTRSAGHLRSCPNRTSKPESRRFIFRGRDAGYPAPPAQIRTCPLSNGISLRIRHHFLKEALRCGYLACASWTAYRWVTPRCAPSGSTCRAASSIAADMTAPGAACCAPKGSALPSSRGSRPVPPSGRAPVPPGSPP